MAELISKDQPREGVIAERMRNGTTYTPRFDIYETDQELVLVGDLPGVSPDDLEVRFENRELSIYGKVTDRHQNADMLYAEYGIGDFYRSFVVDKTIDAEKISAEMKDGVLTLHLPKVAEVQPRKIPVKGA